jgi:hypothetical protein
MARCIGYGEYERKCQNTAGTRWSDLWCLRCDKLRLKTITRQMEGIVAHMQRRELEWLEAAEQREAEQRAEREGGQA